MVVRTLPSPDFSPGFGRVNSTRENRSSKMAKYQIEATIEKLKLNGKNWEVQLKGVGKYLFEKTKSDKEAVKEEEKDKKYLNILEVLPITYTPKIKPCQCPITATSQTYSLFPHILSSAFLEKKKLKFDLKEKEEIKTEKQDEKKVDDIYTITAISHASN